MAPNGPSSYYEVLSKRPPQPTPPGGPPQTSDPLRLFTPIPRGGDQGHRWTELKNRKRKDRCYCCLDHPPAGVAATAEGTHHSRLMSNPIEGERQVQWIWADSLPYR